MQISEEEAIKQLGMLGLKRDEAKRFLMAPEAEKRAIIKTVQERAGVEAPPFYYDNLWPMSPEEGPPLPRKLGIKWPWRR